MALVSIRQENHMTAYNELIILLKELKDYYKWRFEATPIVHGAQNNLALCEIQL